MPKVVIGRTGVRSAPRDVPTDTTSSLMPMTFDAIAPSAQASSFGDGATPAPPNSTAKAAKATATRDIAFRRDPVDSEYMNRCHDALAPEFKADRSASPAILRFELPGAGSGR